MLITGRYDLHDDADAVAKIRIGRIVVTDGRVQCVQRHALPHASSIAAVLCVASGWRPTGDVAWLDYHAPGRRAAGGFLTVDLLRTGSTGSYRSLTTAASAIAEIARLRGAVGVVAHLSNASISDRLMRRWGWTEHLTHWSGRHWIRRFYDGYPPPLPR